MTDRRNVLAGLNLNLFPVLEALMRHKSATRAATELGVTQSAVSHSLRELRMLFDDPLFVRTRTGLEPTTRALEVELELRGALRALEDVVERQDAFDPAESTRRVTLLTADDSWVTVLPRFVASVIREAPKMTIDIRPRTHRWFEPLEQGQADLLLNLSRPVPSWAQAVPLYSETMSCIVSAHRDDIGEELDLETYVSSPHVVVSPEGFGSSSVEQQLEEMGLRRHISAYANTFAMAPEFIAGTDAILTLPTGIAHVMAARLPLRVVAPPLDFDGFQIDVVWHRGRDDASLAWMRRKLVEAASAGK